MLIDRLITEANLSQKAALAVVGLSRSSYHYKPGPDRDPRPLDLALCLAIWAIMERALVYGYRKVLATLLAQDWLVNHKKVLRHTRALGLTQPRKVKGHKYTRPVVRRPEHSNEYWEMDLSYVWCGNQQGYLIAILDAYDKCLPGDYFGDRCRAQEAVQALEQGVLKRFGGEVPPDHRLTLRIDRGPQFKARKFQAAAKRLNVELEYAGIRCPDDKPYIESFIGKYKVEEVYRNEYQNLAEAKTGWELYKVWHENERVHQGLKYRTPKAVFEESSKLALVN